VERALIGLEINWNEVEALYDKLGMAPQVPSIASRVAVPVYRNGKQVGKATSTTWSPTLKKMIALACVNRDQSSIGATLNIEMTVEAVRYTVSAKVVALPSLTLREKRWYPLYPLHSKKQRLPWLPHLLLSEPAQNSLPWSELHPGSLYRAPSREESPRGFSPYCEYSRAGLHLSNKRSAIFPCSIVPCVCSFPKNSAGRFVAACSASIGVSPGLHQQRQFFMQARTRKHETEPSCPFPAMMGNSRPSHLSRPAATRCIKLRAQRELLSAVALVAVPRPFIQFARTCTGTYFRVSCSSLHEELALLVQAGLTPMEALQARDEAASGIFWESCRHRERSSRGKSLIFYC